MKENSHLSDLAKNVSTMKLDKKDQKRINETNHELAEVKLIQQEFEKIIQNLTEDTASTRKRLETWDEYIANITQRGEELRKEQLKELKELKDFGIIGADGRSRCNRHSIHCGESWIIPKKECW